jgi:hypothetical protein
MRGDAEGLPSRIVAFLRGDERTEPCPVDRPYAVTVLDSVLVEECEDMLHAATQDRWNKANTYSYDAARKSVEAWILVHDWRIRPVAGW